MHLFHRTSRFCALLVAALLLAGPGTAGELASNGSTAASPIIAKIHADWCGTCAALEPTWKELQARYGDSARFVVFDVSDRAALVKAAAEAEALGITRFFDAHKGSTGVVAIIDPATGKAVDVFRGELDPARYDGPLAAALGAS